MCRFGSSQRWCCFFWEAGRKKDNISSHLGYHTRTFFLSNIKYLFQSRFACGLHYHLIKNVTGTLPRCWYHFAQLVEHCTGNTKVVGSNPVQSLKICSGHFSSSVMAAFASFIFYLIATVGHLLPPFCQLTYFQYTAHALASTATKSLNVCCV